jgi:hypothetical protein
MKITKYDLIWHIAEYEHVCASSFLQLLVPVVFTTDRSADAQKFWEGVALLHSIQGTYQHMQMVRREEPDHNLLPPFEKYNMLVHYLYY